MIKTGIERQVKGDGSMFYRSVLLLLLCFLNTSTSAQQFFYGNQIHDQCQSSQSYALGYVVGIIDKAARDVRYLDRYHTANRDMSDRAQQAYEEAFRGMKPHCIPENATVGQAGDVVCKFLADNPAKRHLPAAELVPEALAAAWPCRK